MVATGCFVFTSELLSLFTQCMNLNSNSINLKCSFILWRIQKTVRSSHPILQVTSQCKCLVLQQQQPPYWPTYSWKTRRRKAVRLEQCLPQAWEVNRGCLVLLLLSADSSLLSWYSPNLPLQVFSADKNCARVAFIIRFQTQLLALNLDRGGTAEVV